MKRQVLSFFGLAAIFLGLVATPTLAASNVLFILDASGSMWGQIEGVPKIAIAKQVLSALLKDLPKDTKIGLMAYGHRTEGDCKDMELLAPIGLTDPDKLATRLKPIAAKGKTPLAYSLEQSVPHFSSFPGQNNFVILVSDGIETCGGDPVNAASKLAAANIGVKVHVVGFDVKGAERQQLEDIAKAGKGRYFNAQNAQGLRGAFAQVKAEVVQVKPEPKPKFKEYFFDDFAGNKLKDEWEVLNPNPDRFIVEGGQLLVIAAQPGDLSKDTIENLFRLDKPLPSGDWVLTAKVKVDFQTQQERVFLGLYENNQDFLLVQNEPLYGWAWLRPEKFTVELVKNARGQTNKFSWVIFKDFKQGPYKESANSLPQPLLLRLRKEGRTFIGEAMLEGTSKPEWVKIGKFTILAPKGKPVFGFYQSEKVPGESTAVFDWVKIEAVE
ncbi:MAG: VWA domain-containing protein [Thermodesulfobacteriota bacterium]